ncbi:MAG: hypothetical protein K6V97_09285 [Actinomycetia bacterium]|nr:hypothetical protein [Actinomycetes bacterium]
MARTMGRPRTERAPALVVPLLFWVSAGLFGAFGALELARTAAAFLALALGAPGILVAVHSFTLGFLTMTMMGALYQFGPVVLGLRVVPPRRAAGQYALYTGGVVVFLAGLGTLRPLLVGVGAAGVAGGLLWFVAELAPGLGRAASELVPARFVASGLGYLLLVLLLGLLLASTWWRPWLPFRPALLTHLLLGAAGWFSFVSYGVTYRLYPMFLAAPVEARHSAGVFALQHTGVALGVAAAWTGWAVLGVAAATALALAAGLYLADVLAVVRSRRNRRPGAAAGLAVAAAAWLAVGGAFLAAAATTGWARAGVLGAVSLAYGWWAGIVTGFLQKIAPFAVWVYWSRHGRDHTAPHVPRLWPRAWEIPLSAGAGLAPVVLVLGGVVDRIGIVVASLVAEAAVLAALAAGVALRGFEALRARRTA